MRPENVLDDEGIKARFKYSMQCRHESQDDTDQQHDNQQQNNLTTPSYHQQYHQERYHNPNVVHNSEESQPSTSYSSLLTRNVFLSRLNV